jgi:transketolase
MKKLRQEFADTMLEIGPQDPRLVVMVGDISHGILQPYAKACPGRYYNIGICEPTIVNMAAGLNKTGLIPVVHTIAPFITERSYEQIKLDFGYQNLSGNIVSVGGAFDYAQLGCSHHCYTDVSLISHLKRGVVVLPGSPAEFNKLFKETYTNGLINYFRLPDNAHGVEFKDEDIHFGRGICVREGSDATIAVIGSQLRNALLAADKLATQGVSVEVLYFHTIKPFDFALVRTSVAKTKRLLTVEELSAHDGIFNLCLRACLGLNDIAMAQIAIDDFVHGYGSYEELCARIGMSSDGISEAILGLKSKNH